MSLKLKKAFNFSKLYLNIILLNILTYIGPFIFAKIGDLFLKNIELVVSNTQGSREPLYFGASEVMSYSAIGAGLANAAMYIHI